MGKLFTKISHIR